MMQPLLLQTPLAMSIVLEGSIGREMMKSRTMPAEIFRFSTSPMTSIRRNDLSPAHSGAGRRMRNLGRNASARFEITTRLDFKALGSPAVLSTAVRGKSKA